MTLGTIISKGAYFVRGCQQRLTSKPVCPCCGGRNLEPVDRKFPYLLLSCRECRILSRFPAESAGAMHRFYQAAYKQEGLTTDLPDAAELQHLLASNFKGSEKDASDIIRIFEALGVRPPARVLDFGANWGYMTRQFRRHGFQAEAYEISESRAAFGRQLEVDVKTSLDFPRESFDVVFSSHVLEHVPNPLTVLRQQMDLVRPGGFVVGLTPNGSGERMAYDPQSFHRHWGRVHPVLLSAAFIRANFPNHPSFISGNRDIEGLLVWQQDRSITTSLEEGELVFVLKKNHGDAP